MLELIWVHDEQEAQSEAIARTGLWERSRYRQTGASPFGICLGVTDPESLAASFETWGYRPPYVPAGSEIPVALAASFAEPLLFFPRSRKGEGAGAVARRGDSCERGPNDGQDARHSHGQRRVDAGRPRRSSGSVSPRSPLGASR